MSSAEKMFNLADHALEPPTDSEGFVTAFDAVADGEQLRDFFRKYGFVVVKDVVPEETILELQNDIFKIATLDTIVGDGKSPVIDLEKLDAVPWSQVYKGRYNVGKGFLGYEIAETKAAFQVRQSPQVLAAYSAILGTKKLWYKEDRFGLMRPTKNLPNADGETEDRPEWKTGSFVHWDQNIWYEPEFCRVQGLLAVSPHTATSGGFHCIPGAHRVMQEYAEKHIDKKKSGCLVDIPDESDAPLARKITMRPGSFVIWDSRLPHGNWPNDDETFRLVFYLTFFPVVEHAKSFYKATGDALPDDVVAVLTERGKKVTGRLEYTAAEEKEREFRDPIFPLKKDSPYNEMQWAIPAEPKKSIWEKMASSTTAAKATAAAAVAVTTAAAVATLVPQ